MELALFYSLLGRKRIKKANFSYVVGGVSFSREISSWSDEGLKEKADEILKEATPMGGKSSGSVYLDGKNIIEVSFYNNKTNQSRG